MGGSKCDGQGSERQINQVGEDTDGFLVEASSFVYWR